MNTRMADRIFRALFVFIFIFGIVGIPNVRVIAQSPLPQLMLEKRATPATYGQAGDVINYSYLLTNTGSGTLTGPFTVSDNRTVVTCPQNMTPVDLSNTVLFDHFENGNLAQYASDAPAYVGGANGFGQAVDLGSGAWLRYDLSGWYQWGTYYDPAGKAGSVDLWVYPKKYDVELVDINWNYSNTPPGGGGYILHFGINPDGKLTGQAWSSVRGTISNPDQPVTQLSAGNTTIPLKQWTHVAYTWGENGTRLYVNGIQYAFSPDNLYPALNSINYVYVPYWGFPDLGYIDDLRITSSSQTNFGVSALAPGESLTCIGSYTITQTDVDNGTVTNTAQAHGFFGSTPIDSNQDTATVTVPNPILAAFLFNNRVEGFSWPQGKQVTLTIDDPDYGPGIDYTETQTSVVSVNSLDPTQTSARFQLPGFTLQPGQILTMTDGKTTKIHTVTSLTLGGGDRNNETVWGTAAPGSVIDVMKQTDHNIFRRVSADGQGNWLADFSIHGDEPGEENPYDIQAGDVMMVMQNDNDGDHTQVDWQALTPDITAAPSNDWISGEEWPVNATVSIKIDDPSTSDNPDFSTTQMATEAGWRPAQLGGNFQYWSEYKFSPGDTITLSDGITTKSLVVSDIQITAIDVANDAISGNTDPNRTMWVFVHGENGAMKQIQSDSSGNWSVDFTGEYDIQPGTEGSLKVFDNDQDMTHADWRAPNPYIEASPNSNWIHARDWPINTVMTMTISGSSETYTATMAQAPWNSGGPNDIVAYFDLKGYHVKAGDVITATGNGSSKALTVSQLEATNFDLENDTIQGKGTNSLQIQVCANVPNNCITRWATPNDSGDWTVNYQDSGIGNDDPDTFDIQHGSNGWAAEYDADYDRTWYDWQVPNPTISARANEDRIEGNGWTYGSTVVIEINDPATDVNPDYQDTATVGFADWDPNQTWFGFNTNDYDIKAGDQVKGTSGVITKQLLVSGYEITSFDLETERVYGTADQGQRVNIWTCWQSDPCVNRHETAGQEGNWVTDFSVPGEQAWEQATADLRPGSWIDSSVSDEDGDSTMFGFGVSNPTLHAVPTYPEVHGHDWPAGADVTLTIDNDADPANGVLYTRTKNADDDPWCGYPCFDLSDVFDLQNGQYVTMTDGVITKVVQVSTLKIMSVDLANDTLSGVAGAGSDVMVNIWSQDGKARHTVADENGNWLVDFSIVGDEDFEQFKTDITDLDNGRAIQLNPDGTDDGTLEYWPMINNPPVANAGPDLEDYAGNTITLDASASSDPEAGMLTYEWDLDNDGQYDDASGVTTTISFNQVGDHIIGLQVTDDGGLSDTDTVRLTVLPWTLKGFYQPVDMNGVYNVTKNGTTVPFKFEIFAGTAELTDVALIKSVNYVQTSCDVNAATDQIEVTSSDVTSLHYDAEGGQFIYKWKTPKTAGVCYRVTMITADGSSLLAYFKLK